MTVEQDAVHAAYADNCRTLAHQVFVNITSHQYDQCDGEGAASTYRSGLKLAKLARDIALATINKEISK